MIIIEKKRKPFYKVKECKLDNTVVTYKNGKVKKVEYVLDCKKVKIFKRTASEVLYEWLYR